MVIMFGLSIGDFISGLVLFRDLIKALADKNGPSAEYRELINELNRLEGALTEVYHLNLDESQSSQCIAVEIAQCQNTIDDFLRKAKKFEPMLQPSGSPSTWSGSPSTWKASIRKVQWALYKKDDIEKLRVELMGHTSLIILLLMAIQTNSTALQGQKLFEQLDRIQAKAKALGTIQSDVQRNKDLLESQMGLLLSLIQNMTSSITQKSRDMDELMTKIHMVLRPQRDIPLQVKFQQPVLLEDPHGRILPFYVEFINCREAFEAVMEVRFRHVPGLRKFQAGEYVIQELHTNREINLAAPWESVFLPGRKVNMSMIFKNMQTTQSTCPGCHIRHGVQEDTAIKCPNCGLCFQRVTEPDQTASTSSPATGPATAPIEKIQQFLRVRFIEPPRLRCMQPSCSITCSRKSDLYRHARETHTQRFACPAEGCGKGCPGKDRLGTHVFLYHWVPGRPGVGEELFAPFNIRLVR